MALWLLFSLVGWEGRCMRSRVEGSVREDEEECRVEVGE